MKISAKGLVTIPVALREFFGLFPHTEVEMIKRKNGILIKKIENDQPGNELINHMSGTATIKLTTEEIMKLTRCD